MTGYQLIAAVIAFIACFMLFFTEVPGLLPYFFLARAYFAAAFLMGFYLVA